MLDALIGTAGIVAATDLAVTANGTPNMSVNVAAGAAFIQGTSSTYQGIYHAFNDATVNLAIAASDPTNPRIDIVCARIRDAVYLGGSTNDFSLVVVTGTPAGTPAAPATPADSIVLAQVAVAHSVTTIIAGYITDNRVAAGYVGVPAGSINAFAGATAPVGWLACDGSAVSRTTYAALFAVLASTYGAGDGSTTFNLPDMRGRAPIGAGTGSGLTARALAAQVGEEAHALSIAELAAHTHTTNWGAYAQAGTTFSDISKYPQISNAVGGAPFIVSTSTGSGTAHNTMQPSLALNYIVKT